MKQEFKQTEIGEIPEGWKIKPAEEFCLRVTDGTHYSPQKQSAGKFLVTSRHLKEGHLDFDNAYFISEEDYIETNRRSKVDRWDVIFSMIGTVGEIYLEKRDDINYAIKNVGLFKSGKNELIGKWLFYYFKSNIAREYIHRSRAGTTQEYLTLESLRKFPILFPANKAMMSKIIGILDSIQDKIELNRQMNKTLESIAQAIFKRWFVDFEFPGHEKTKFVNNLPEGWYGGCLADILEISIGGDWGNDNETEGMVQAISLRGTDLESLKSGGYAPEAPVRWIRKDKLGKRIIRDSDILIGGSGLGPIGKTIYCSRYLNGLYAFPVTYSNFCKRLTAKTPGFAVYAEKILENMYLSGEMNQFYTGTSIPNLDVNSLIKFPVIIPTAGIVSKFYEIVAHKFMKLFNKENTLLSQIRDSLLPRLMSGKIRINA